MTHAASWRRIAMVILILVSLVVLFHVLGAPGSYTGG